MREELMRGLRAVVCRSLIAAIAGGAVALPNLAAGT
jgi:hypothetical protein